MSCGVITTARSRCSLRVARERSRGWLAHNKSSGLSLSAFPTTTTNLRVPRRWWAQRYDDGFVAGINYVVVPGLTGYAEYLYGQVHQGGVNLLGVGTAAEHNDVHSQALILGTRLQW